MAAFYNNKEINQLIFKFKSIQALYKGALLIWEAVRSCFGSGMWVKDKPWIRKEGWKETNNH